MKNLIVNTLISLTVMTIVILVYHNIAKEKTAFVDSRVLFEEFKMKKELEADYMMIENRRKAILDSIEFGLKRMNPNAYDDNIKQTDPLFYSYLQDYANKKAEFQELNLALTNQYNEQIWKRINTYVKEFGKENGYDYIFGLTDDPIILFSNESKDITQNVVGFINARYEGK